MKCKEDFIVLFLTHLGTSAMMDLLLQMVAAPDSDQIRLDLAVVSTCDVMCWCVCVCMCCACCMKWWAI